MKFAQWLVITWLRCVAVAVTDVVGVVMCACIPIAIANNIVGRSYQPCKDETAMWHPA
jgi:hypothetical protein